jgi:hypothetical protein
MKGVKAPVGNVRVALAGVFESRMETWVVRGAISTQLFPSPPPEYEDLRQVPGVFMGCLTVPW